MLAGIRIPICIDKTSISELQRNGNNTGKSFGQHSIWENQMLTAKHNLVLRGKN